MSHLEIFPFHDHVDHDISDVIVAPLLAEQTLDSFDLLCTGAPNSYFMSNQPLVTQVVGAGLCCYVASLGGWGPTVSCNGCGGFAGS